MATFSVSSKACQVSFVCARRYLYTRPTASGVVMVSSDTFPNASTTVELANALKFHPVDYMLSHKDMDFAYFISSVPNLP